MVEDPERRKERKRNKRKRNRKKGQLEETNERTTSEIKSLIKQPWISGGGFGGKEWTHPREEAKFTRRRDLISLAGDRARVTVPACHVSRRIMNILRRLYHGKKLFPPTMPDACGDASLPLKMRGNLRFFFLSFPFVAENSYVEFVRRCFSSYRRDQSRQEHACYRFFFFFH